MAPIFSMLRRLVAKRVWAPSAEQLCTVVANCGLCNNFICELSIAKDDVVMLQSVVDRYDPSIGRPALFVQQIIRNVLDLITTWVLMADLKLEDLEKLLQLLLIVASDLHWRETELLSIARICAERLFMKVASVERDDLWRRLQDFLRRL